jgi:hypothetical protein
MEGLKKQGALDIEANRRREVERVKRVAGATPIGDIRGVQAATESQLEKARQAFSRGEKDVGFEILGDVELTDVEAQKLRQGGGGAVGQQAVLMRDISQMEAMSAGEFRKFQKRLQKGAGGIDLISSIQGSMQGAERERFEDMLKGGLTTREAMELQEKLEKAAPQAFGRGGGRGGRDPFMQMLTEYTSANKDFVWAVKNALGKEGISLAEDADKVASMPTPTKAGGES